jgi:hypothetical protein
MRLHLWPRARRHNPSHPLCRRWLRRRSTWSTTGGTRRAQPYMYGKAYVPRGQALGVKHSPRPPSFLPSPGSSRSVPKIDTTLRILWFLLFTLDKAPLWGTLWELPHRPVSGHCSWDSSRRKDQAPRTEARTARNRSVGVAKPRTRWKALSVRACAARSPGTCGTTAVAHASPTRASCVSALWAVCCSGTRRDTSEIWWREGNSTRAQEGLYGPFFHA